VDDEQIALFTSLETSFNEAMISNDVRQISRCISDDWALVTPEAGPVTRERILSVIADGTLQHAAMTKDIVRIKQYGDIALVTGRGCNSGQFAGAPITADEWITDVYQKTGDRWLCVLTHLTPALPV
jgi:ketosteroid isomerase-like protein